MTGPVQFKPMLLKGQLYTYSHQSLWRYLVGVVSIILRKMILDNLVSLILSVERF